MKTATGLAIAWFGFGRDWSGVATGHVNGDYARVRLDPGSEAWEVPEPDTGIGSVLIGLVQPVAAREALLGAALYAHAQAKQGAS